MSKENPRIIRNSAKCKLCEQEVESRYRHSFCTCKCGAMSVDGGKAYIRRLAKSFDDVEETSIFDETQEPQNSDYD